MNKLSKYVYQLSGALERPRKVSVVEGVKAALRLKDPGGFSGKWKADRVPYLHKPMNCLTSRHHEAVCFVGPARTGKTAGLIVGGACHAVLNDPGNMMIIHMTEAKAQELSKLDFTPAIETSPLWKEKLGHRGRDDNIMMKHFTNGMVIKFAYPSPSHLAGGTYRYVFLTDYDRFQGSAGTGEVFDNAHKRTETAMSRRMTMVESSPEGEIRDPKYRLMTPHEAPPCGGILSIYNRGDRQQYYWKCPECGEFFRVKPGLSLFASLPDEDELIASIRGLNIPKLAKEHAIVFCEHCGSAIEERHKYAMNQGAVWVPDGVEINREGELSEEFPPSPIASFWLGGAAAAYQKWGSILQQYFYGLQEFAATGSEEKLRQSYFTDLCYPYLPRAFSDSLKKKAPAELADTFDRYVVPEQARYIVLSVDVQGGKTSRFCVQVNALGPDHEVWVIDRYDITHIDKAKKTRCDPGRHPEHWDVLEQAAAKTYRTCVPGEELRVYGIVVDSGGEAQTTVNAYRWWRKLGVKLQRTSVLYKGRGRGTANAAIIRLSKVGGKGGASNDVPQLDVNTNTMKDEVFNGIRREEDGPGKIHLAGWLPPSYFDELEAEVRLATGKYEKIRDRNEALDLCVMIRSYSLFQAINWSRPPPHARPVMENTYRERREDRRERVKHQGFKQGGFAQKTF